MASLKDLAPAEKQKVAHLIRQVVDKERALKELEAAGGGGADAARAEALEEQNRELARENTSLRAKLSHAFDLLRTYQHKVRVLDARGALTGSASAAASRPATPLGGGTAAGAAVAAPRQPPLPLQAGVDPQQLAAGLLAFGGGDGAGPDPTGCSAPLSPVAESVCEGACPGSPPAGVVGAAEPAAAGLQLQLVAPQAALPQLDTIKLLARALLEAQAEVAAQHAPPQCHAPAPVQQQQQQQQQLRDAAYAACCGSGGPAPLPAAAGAGGAAAPGVPPGAQLVFDSTLSPHGAYRISPSSEASSAAGCTAGGGGDVLAAECSTCASSQRAPLAPLQQQQSRPDEPAASLSCAASAGRRTCPAPGSSGRAAPASCRPLAFDDSLTDLVRDVESLALGQGAGAGGAGGGGGGHWQASGHGRWGAVQAGAGCAGAEYEENDLLSLLEHL